MLKRFLFDLCFQAFNLDESLVKLRTWMMELKCKYWRGFGVFWEMIMQFKSSLLKIKELLCFIMVTKHFCWTCFASRKYGQIRTYEVSVVTKVNKESKGMLLLINRKFYTWVQCRRKSQININNCQCWSHLLWITRGTTFHRNLLKYLVPAIIYLLSNLTPTPNM